MAKARKKTVKKTQHRKRLIRHVHEDHNPFIFIILALSIIAVMSYFGFTATAALLSLMAQTLH